MSNLVEHLEYYLGPIVQAWQKDADGTDMPFQILKFRPRSLENTSAFTTLGLARHPLRLDSPGKDTRLELMTLTNEGDASERYMPSVLQQIADECHRAGAAPLRGQVLGPRGPIVPGTLMEAFYAAIPVYFPDKFASHSSGAESTIIVWLIPVHPSEARYVEDHGWQAFEELLIKEDPDLVDWGRPSLLST